MIKYYQKKNQRIFSEELTGKFKGEKDKNKKIMNEIIKEDRDIKLINFLKKTLKEAYQDYIRKENIISEYLLICFLSFFFFRLLKSCITFL